MTEYMLVIRTGKKSGWKFYGEKPDVLARFSSIQRGE